MKQIDRDALRDWEEYKNSIANSTEVDPGMSVADIEKHRKYLEEHPVEWIKFFSQSTQNMNLPISTKKQ